MSLHGLTPAEFITRSGVDRIPSTVNLSAWTKRGAGHGAHSVVVCDGAGWHQQGKRLRVPDNLTLLPLPPYAPELNPIENVWNYLRGNKLSKRVWDSYEAIVAACKDAWLFLVGDPERINSLAHRCWASVIL